MLRQPQIGLTALSHLLLAAALLTGESFSWVQALGKEPPVSTEVRQEAKVAKKTAPFTLSVRRVTTQTGFPEIASSEDLVSAQSLMIEERSFEELSKLCAPELSPATAYRIAREFSGASPWSVSITGGSVIAAQSEELALALISKLKEKGKSVSLGLFQLPEEFIVQAGADLPSALEPCRNLRLASRFLLSRFRDSLSRHGKSFLAAREALEDLRAAAGRSTCYTHAAEGAVLDSDFSGPEPVGKTGSSLTAQTGLIKAGKGGQRRGEAHRLKKEARVPVKPSEERSAQIPPNYSKEKNVFTSAGNALSADAKNVLSTSNQKVF